MHTLLLSILAIAKRFAFGLDFGGWLMIEERLAAQPTLDQVGSEVDSLGVGEASLQWFSALLGGFHAAQHRVRRRDDLRSTRTAATPFNRTKK